MTLAFIENGAVTKYPASAVELRKKYPNTSFPSNLDSVDLTNFGAAVVVAVDLPTYDYNAEFIEEGTPVFDGQQWNQVWNVVALTAEELQQRTANKARNVRDQRNEKLANTDWRVTYEVEKAAVDGLGIQLPTVWSDYRQALRDLTSQPGFPHNVTWPTEPST